MKALYIAIGVLVGYAGLAALTDGNKLERILFPAILVAAAMIANAFRSRNKLEAAAGAGAVLIAMGYATGYFRDGAALNWTATWLVVAGLVWVVTGLFPATKQEELIGMIKLRSKRPAPSSEDPFAAAAGRGAVRDVVPDPAFEVFDQVRKDAFAVTTPPAPTVQPPAPMVQPGHA